MARKIPDDLRVTVTRIMEVNQPIDVYALGTLLGFRFGERSVRAREILDGMAECVERVERDSDHYLTRWQLR